MANSTNHQAYAPEQIINGYKTKTYRYGFEYTGTWENGRKVGEGILSRGPNKVKVKTKEGKIYKCVQVLTIAHLSYYPITAFQLPGIKVLKVGDYYVEEDSDAIEFFYIVVNGELLFDGKSCINFQEFPRIYKHFKLFTGYPLNSESSYLKILDFSANDLKFVGKGFNCHPNGPNKIYLYDFIYKGNMKGLFYDGVLTVKNQIFKAIINRNIRKKEKSLKVTSKVFNFEISINKSPIYKDYVPGNTGLNIDIANYYMSEILVFVKQAFKGIRDIFKTMMSFNISSSLVSFKLIDNLNWEAFEKIFRNKNSKNRDKKPLSIESNQKYFKKFDNSEVYEGRIANGKLDGFGKYIYLDGGVYAGEFKNNLRDGLGTFNFRDGRMYRGYWKNNLMDGKGYMMNKGVKIYGTWEKNEMVQKRSLIMFD